MNIESKTVESEFLLLLNKLVNFGLVPSGQIKYIFADGIGDKYDLLILNSRLTKPTLQEFETELETYKEELRMAKAAQTAKEVHDKIERTRIADWGARLDAIPNIREVMKSRNEDQPNSAIYMRDFIKDKTVADLEAVEAKSAELAQVTAIKDAIETKAKRGKDVRVFCSYLLDIVAGSNIDSGLDDAALDLMEVELGPIQQALQNNRPMKAKTLVLAIVDPKYDTLKTLVLSIYAGAGL